MVLYKGNINICTKYSIVDVFTNREYLNAKEVKANPYGFAGKTTIETDLYKATAVLIKTKWGYIDIANFNNFLDIMKICTVSRKKLILTSPCYEGNLFVNEDELETLTNTSIKDIKIRT